MNRLPHFIALPILSLVLLAGCGTTGPTPVRIGYIGPLTGDAVSYGKDTLNATQLALDEWNASGGINGRPIKLIAEDGACNASEGALAAHKLIDVDHVTAILGGNCSTETMAAAPIAEQNHVILLAPISSSKDVTSAGDFIFRMWPSNAKAADIAYKAFFATHTPKRIAMVSDQTNYCQSLRVTVKTVLPAGSQLVFDEMPEVGSKDFRSLLSRLKKTPYDLLYLNLQGDASIGTFMSQYRALGLTGDVLANDIAESATLTSIAGHAMDDVYVLSLASPEQLKEPGKRFVDAFIQQFGKPKQAPSFPAVAYDGANILFNAIKQAGTDGPAIRDALYGMPAFDGATGEIRFDVNGDAEGMPYALKQWANGTVKQLTVIPLE